MGTFKETTQITNVVHSTLKSVQDVRRLPGLIQPSEASLIKGKLVLIIINEAMKDCIVQDDTVPRFSLKILFFCVSLQKPGFYSFCTQTFQRNLEPDPLPAKCVVQ